MSSQIRPIGGAAGGNPGPNPTASFALNPNFIFPNAYSSGAGGLKRTFVKRKTKKIKAAPFEKIKEEEKANCCRWDGICEMFTKIFSPPSIYVITFLYMAEKGA